MRVLVTGGAGFIGSTVVSALLDAGHDAVILDDLSTGSRVFTEGREFVQGDVADPDAVARAVGEGVDATIHCAAAIVVPESVARPLHYYRTNVAATVELLDTLGRLGCRRFVFSSSASIYVPGADWTVDENSPIEPGSPYAASKAMVERILRDAAAAGVTAALSLRYFNPIGADPRLRSGLQLADPSHALGRLITAHESGEPFTVTGTDWPTRDGSGIRDYIHVWDLARAHVRAIERFDEVLPGPSGYDVINVGTGRGTTVRELVAAFTAVVGPLEVRDGPRRPGDVVGSYTRNERATRLLGWTAELSIEQGVRDSLAWAAIRAERLGTES